MRYRLWNRRRWRVAMNQSEKREYPEYEALCQSLASDALAEAHEREEDAYTDFLRFVMRREQQACA
ncbi:MAG TPA: hypothetical protein VND45_12810 [Thermoanaerobaculia bacterium]|nr:hypothetical protein [Thermoanaerobaculia bacterium]